MGEDEWVEEYLLYDELLMKSIIIEIEMQITYKNFCLLHDHLLMILTTNNFDDQNLPEKALQYVGMIVESEKKPKETEDYFDYFCQNQGNSILKVILEVNHLLAIKCLSLLFINLKNQIWISYLLCQPFVNEAIQHTEIPNFQEWAEYFISFLKSLSIRINIDQISLFFNKKCCKFPLVYESLKYYNHQDCMVRTNVMNIILGIMKIKDQRLSKYFSSFPFTSYILTYCCEIRDRIQKFNSHLLEVSHKMETSSSPRALKNNHKAVMKMYSIDLADYISYLDDLMSFGSEDLAFFIRNAILCYIVLPNLKNIHLDLPRILVKSSIYLMFYLFKLINDNKFKETLCLLMLGKQIPKIYAERLQKIQDDMYTPKVYEKEFDASKYFWNKYEYQVESQCLNLFKDVEHFETDHDSQKEDSERKKQFQKEINCISQFLSFNILNYKKMPNKNMIPVSCLPELLGMSPKSQWIPEQHEETQFEINPTRNELRKIWFQVASDEEQDDLLTCISTIIVYIIRCDTLENHHLKFCGFLLPRFDTVNYLDEFNINSLTKLKQTILSTLKSNTMKKISETTPIMRLSSLRNLLFLLDEGLYKRLSIDEEAILHNFYSHAIQQLKQLVNAKNMKDLVENFQFDFGKWWKDCFIPDNHISYSIFGFRTQFGKDSPNDDIQPQFICQISNQKQHVQYAIRYFIIAQAYYLKYVTQHTEDEEERLPLQPYAQKYTKLYQEKYGKIEEFWKIGKSYEIDYRHMVECQGANEIVKNKKGKKQLKTLIIVEDTHNLIIVEPSSEENKAKILINNPWKYIKIQINREEGKKMMIEISHCMMGQARIQLYFQDEVRCAGTLEWMNKLKYERFQSEQAFILGYLKECLSYQ